jgi:hypothetical protein
MASTYSPCCRHSAERLTVAMVPASHTRKAVRQEQSAFVLLPDGFNGRAEDRKNRRERATKLALCRCGSIRRHAGTRRELPRFVPTSPKGHRAPLGTHPVQSLRPSRCRAAGAPAWRRASVARFARPLQWYRWRSPLQKADCHRRSVCRGQGSARRLLDDRRAVPRSSCDRTSPTKEKDQCVS